MSTEITTIIAAVTTLGLDIRVGGRPKNSADLNALNAQINPSEANDDLACNEAVSNLDYRAYYPAMHRGAVESLIKSSGFERAVVKTTPKKSGGESVVYETVATYVKRGIAEGAFTSEDVRKALQDWADANPWYTTVLTGATRQTVKFDKDILAKATDLRSKLEAGIDPSVLEAKIGSYVEGYVLDLEDDGLPTMETIARGLTAMQKAMMANSMSL